MKELTMTEYVEMNRKEIAPGPRRPIELWEILFWEVTGESWEEVRDEEDG